MSTESGHDHGHGHGHGSETALARIEALSKEGVHHAGDHEGPFSVHVLGLGPAGASLITAMAADAPEGFTALAVDIGAGSLSAVTPSAAVQTVELPIPTKADLSTALNRYREFLKMEYPRYYWNPNYEPWLPGDLEIPGPGEPMPRAIAKAIYGAEYYQNREITHALDAFAAGVLSSDRTPLVVVAFSLAETVGSGIVVEIARHLSSIKLGRRPWVVGLGVLPAAPEATFFPVINELDCMIDTEKNNGVMAVWGDLYKTPSPVASSPCQPGTPTHCPAWQASCPLAAGGTFTRRSRRSTGSPYPATSGTRRSAASRAIGGSHPHHPAAGRCGLAERARPGQGLQHRVRRGTCPRLGWGGRGRGEGGGQRAAAGRRDPGGPGRRDRRRAGAGQHRGAQGVQARPRAFRPLPGRLRPARVGRQAARTPGCSTSA